MILKLNMLGGIELGLDFTSLDWNTIKGMIVGFGSQAKTEAINDDLKTKLDIMGMGQISFITDNDYNLKEIEIGDFSFEGIGLSGKVDAKIDTEDIKTVTKPQNAEQATDVTEFDTVLGAVDKLLTKRNLSGVALLNVAGNKTKANYEINFNQTNGVEFYCDTMIASQKLVVRYHDNKVYVSFDDLKYYFNLENFDLNQVFDNVNLILHFPAFNDRNV